MKKERLSKLTKLLHSIPSTNGERLLIELTELSENLGLSENTIERLKTELKDGKGYLDKYFLNIEMDNSINHLLKDNEGLKSKLKKWCELELASIITDIIGNRKYAMGVARVLSIKYMESRNSMKSSLVISKLNNKKDNLKDLDESIIVETSGGNEVEIFVEDNSQKSSFPIPRYFLFGLIDALAQDSNHPLKKVRLKGIKHENGTYEVQISNYLEDQWPLPDIEDLLQEPDHDRNVRFWIKCLNDLLPLKKGIVCKINKESKPYSINICWEECDPEKYNTSVQFEQKPVEVDTRDYNDLSFDEVKQIADTGVMMAQTNLAERYFFGAGIEQDYKKAFDYYSNSAEMGDIKAQYKLGFSLINALGTESSFQEGVEWLKKAADQDCEHALFYLGSKTLLDSITSGVEIEFLTKDMSADYSKRAANSGNKQAQVQIGSDYSIADVKQIDEIHRWFRTAADQGYAEAFYQLGIINMGNDENQKDLERAFQFFSRASKLQHSGAQNMLGEMYFNGMFKNTNKKLAIDLFERAEKQGCPYSQMKLGLIEFLKLSDEPENLTRAVGYFEEVIKFG
ncbi:MAG: sel1 repeat family protein, partial [Deltaproteobacteria bacterium]|nr:sel1 repeat family protein [Deltaproteobacteria bacterium]